MATTPRFRSWRRARPKLAAAGLTSAMTGRSAGRTRRRRFTTPRGIDRANIQSGISMASSASCRPTLTAAIIGSTGRIDDPVRLSRRCAGATAGAKFFELADLAANVRRGKNAAPISPIALEAVASTPSSTSSARSMASRPRSGSLRAAQGAHRSSPRSKSGCAPNAPSSPGTTPSPRPSITCSRAGWPSPASSRTAASA